MSLFTELDDDGSGDVDTIEFIGGLKDLGCDMSEEEFKLLYNDCDANGDGVLTEVREEGIEIATRLLMFRPSTLTPHPSPLTPQPSTLNPRPSLQDEFTDELSKHFPEVKKMGFWQRRATVRAAKKAEKKKKKEVAKVAKETAANAAEKDASLIEDNLKLIQREVDEKKVAEKADQEAAAEDLAEKVKQVGHARTHARAQAHAHTLLTPLNPLHPSPYCNLTYPSGAGVQLLRSRPAQGHEGGRPDRGEEEEATS